MISNTDIDLVRHLCVASARRLGINNRDEALFYFRAGHDIGIPDAVLSNELKQMLTAGEHTDFDKHDLRSIQRAFRFERAIGLLKEPWDEVVGSVVAAMPVRVQVRRPTEPVWAQAIDTARALVHLRVPVFEDPRIIAVAAAGARLAQRGFRLAVVLQVALSMVLVTGTGLPVSSLQNLLDVNLGFQREHLLSVAIDPRVSVAAKPQDPLELRRVLDQVVAVPGVQSASLAMCGLLSVCRARMDFSQIEGYQARPDEQVVFLLNVVTPDYFSTVGIRLIAGRTLTDRDQSNSSKEVAVVNETLARKYFNDGRAVGRRFGEKALDIEIVGIVEDARVLSVKDPVEPTVP